MPIPEPEEQVQFLFKLQRLLTEGLFTATYKHALILALAELAVERGDDSTERLVLDSRDIAEKYIDVYWRQCLPWIPPGAGGRAAGRLLQATGQQGVILNRISRAHDEYQGSLSRLRADRRAWGRLVAAVAATVARYPLWRLQTVGRASLEFLYPNVGRGDRIELRGEAVYCLRRFFDLVADLTRSAWVRFVVRLPANRPLLGDWADLHQFLFGIERGLLTPFRRLLLDDQDGRCFYCDGAIKGEAVVDHFVPWARYPQDLGHNLVAADVRCNSAKGDRLPAYTHLLRWSERNGRPELTQEFVRRALPHDILVTRRVASWAYRQTDINGATVWEGGNRVVRLDPRWRELAGLGPAPSPGQGYLFRNK